MSFAVCRAALAEEVMGHPQQGAAAIQQTTAQIMARDLAQSHQTRVPHLAPRYGLSRENAIATSVSSDSSGALPAPLSAFKAQTVSPTINFTAANFNDCSGWPPDTMGTVGPTQFIIALNGRIRSFNKATGLADGAINADTDTFFAPVMTPGSNFTTDPRIRYDRLSGLWFVIMIDVPGQQGKLPNRVMIAVSNSGTITAGTVWSFFQFSGDPSNFADYPTLGVDANALYIGANIFSTSTGSLINTTGFVVQKSSLLSGGPIVVTPFTGLIATGGHPPRSAGPFTPQGVDNYDPAATEGYFIGVDISSTSTLQLRRVSNPGSTPSLSGNVSITVSSFAPPINVTVQGTSGTLDALGSPSRLMAAHFRSGSLWTSQNVGVNSSGGNSSPDRNGVRWYQLQGIPTGQTPSVAQSGTIFQPGGAVLSYWMGTIMVSGQGHAAAGFTQAGPNNFLDAATTGRLAGDPPGAMDPPVSYTSSSSAYNPSDGSSPHRWGDYSYTSLDPADDMTMWTVQEWCQSSGNGFAVQVAKLLAPAPALPTGCSPSMITQGTSGISVTITGSATNGSGFFDPGSGFPNRLGVTVNGGGITVASVTYNNPSNLTAVLNVAGNANPGARTITITNPDGQTATSASGLVTVVTASGNQPPSLAPIPDQTVAVGMTLTYTNVANDPDGDQLTFRLGAGAAANATINPSTGVFTWAPAQPQIGTNQFSVIVNDNGTPSLSATQSFHVVVVQSNSPPTLAPISNKEVAVEMSLTITNTASDPDGDQLTFSLGSGAPANATIDASSGLFTWAPTAAQIGNHGLSVIVTDNGFPSLSATQSFSVLVVQSNSPPTLAPIANKELALGMTLLFTNSASDPDGDQLAFSLGSGATNATLNATNGVFTWTPASAQLGSNNFNVIVTDNGFPSLSATQTFDVFVVPSNSPPTLAPIADQEVAVGMTLMVTNTASDPDGDQLTFSLGAGAPANATINPSTGLFTWAPTQVQIGNHALSVIVADYGFPSLSATQSFSVLVVQSNSPPTLAPIANQEVAVGMTLTVTNTASDPDGDQLTFSLGSGAPANATIDATTGLFTWAPTQAQIGNHALSVIVTDNGFPSLSATQSFSVLVVQSNSPPTLAPISNSELALGMTLIFTNTATDPDGNELIFSLDSGAATNATLNATNGVFTWTPTSDQLGSNNFIVVVTDNGFPALSATQSFSVLVVQSNSPPTLAPISNSELALGMTLVFTNTATDPDGDELIFSLDSGAATNATLNATNGVFTWTPMSNQLGSNNFSVIVTDNGFPSLSATQTFDVFVVPSNSPPTLAPITDQQVAVGMTLTVTNTASDPDGDHLTFSLGAGAPANATIDAATGLLTWTTSDTQLGSNTFSVIVTDNGFPSLSATQSFTVLVVQSNSPPTLAIIPDQSVYALTTLRFTNSATDPDVGQTLTFSLGPGAPTGASVDAASGIFTWTPIQAQIGSSSLTVQVTDNGLPNLSDSKSFAVSVLVGPVLRVADVSTNAVTLAWDAVPGTTYRVQYSTNLADAVWLSLTPDVLATNSTATLTDTNPQTVTFYRLLVVP